MKPSRYLLSREALKLQAKRLRAELASQGQEISHSNALELVARQHGERDWNTLCARSGNELQLQPGDRVKGRYLGQDFQGEILGLTLQGTGESRRVTLHFDQPVDVVKFESFSSLRQRVSGEIGLDGCSARKTSDGVPQLIVSEILQS